MIFLSILMTHYLGYMDVFQKSTLAGVQAFTLDRALKRCPASLNITWETEYIDNGYIFYKRRTLTHSLQQVAQKTNPLSIIKKPGTQPTIG